MKFPRLLPRRRWVRVTLMSLLAAVVFFDVFGCNANVLVLGWNNERIDPQGAARKAVVVQGKSVEVWVSRSPGAQGREPRAFLLLFVGKMDRADRWVAAVAASWRDKPVEVWSMNYPGSGGSEGPVSIDRVAPDALAVYDSLRREAGSRPIFIQGNSFGTTAALCVAAQRPVRALFLHNPPPLRQLILGEYSWWNFGLISRHIAAEVPPELDSIANAARSSAPAVFVFAEADEVVPHPYHLMVYNAYSGPKSAILIPHGHHNDPLRRETVEQLAIERDRLWQQAIVEHSPSTMRAAE